MNELDILRAEHDVMHNAISDWIGMNNDSAKEDLQYLIGIHNMADKLIEAVVAESK